MSEDNTTPKKTKEAPEKEAPVKDETVQQEAPKAPAPKKASEPKFAVERLVSQSLEFFGPGYPKYVVAGGLSGTKGDLTVKDAKAQIDKWLDTDIKE
jgi:hypothetical protein